MKLTALQKVQFGAWLRFLRRQAKPKLTQKALAKRALIEFKRYQKYEYGDLFPRRENLTSLAEALGHTVEHLLCGIVAAAANEERRARPRDCTGYTLPRAAALDRPELRAFVVWMEEADVDVVTIVNGGPFLNVMLTQYSKAPDASPAS